MKRTTIDRDMLANLVDVVAFTPKGGCPLKHAAMLNASLYSSVAAVAFTPKGGCPLKRTVSVTACSRLFTV